MCAGQLKTSGRARPVATCPSTLLPAMLMTPVDGAMLMNDSPGVTDERVATDPRRHRLLRAERLLLHGDGRRRRCRSGRAVRRRRRGGTGRHGRRGGRRERRGRCRRRRRGRSRSSARRGAGRCAGSDSRRRAGRRRTWRRRASCRRPGRARSCGCPAALSRPPTSSATRPTMMTWPAASGRRGASPGPTSRSSWRRRRPGRVERPGRVGGVGGVGSWPRIRT